MRATARGLLWELLLYLLWTSAPQDPPHDNSIVGEGEIRTALD